ncbi:MAG TPA: hypothetical protein VFS05_03095 [Gemmatimonadaceae bacterium]|nr:hypothetical protein [Gemmatimonadaceae bacterium]
MATNVTQTTLRVGTSRSADPDLSQVALRVATSRSADPQVSQVALRIAVPEGSIVATSRAFAFAVFIG